MKLLKKLTICVLSLIFTASLTVGILSASKISAKANAVNYTATQTTMFMPATKLEFYDLKSPQAICYSDGYLIITEYEQGGTNKLIVYNPQTNSFEVNLSPSLVNVTCVARYQNYLLLLFNSSIYTLSLDDITAEPVNAGVPTATSFSVCNNAIVANTSSGIYKYNIEYSRTEDKLKFTELDKNNVSGVLSCLLSTSGEFYYFQSGRGLVKRNTDDATEVVIYNSVPNVDIAPSYMAEVGNYVYFTTPSGLYKVKKEANAELIQVIPVSENGGLGSLKQPCGLTVKDGKLLVADTALNCIQEIDVTIDEFTQFAVTTESTADYRLTNNATQLTLSENYVYALDNSTVADGETTPKKRIVKISLDSTNKTYEKIDLSPVYDKYPDCSDIKYAASDTHVLVSDGENVTLYEQNQGKPITLTEAFTYKKHVTAVYYLDDDFYFATFHTDIFSANESYAQIYKIQLPSIDNELTEITLSTITTSEPSSNFSKAIVGKPIDMTVDIFGNVYVLTTNGSESEFKIQRYYAGNVISTEPLSEKPTAIETDFAGNVYALTNGKITKYEFNNAVTVSDEITVNCDGMTLKDLALNYRSNKAYFLSDACVLVTNDDNLNVQNLSRICADSVNPTTLQQSQQFITVDKNAKLFKVTINDYVTEGGKNYFRTIEPISNPNTSKIYLIIADVDDDYYLISYSQKFTALVKKSSVQANSSTSIVPNENFELLGIKQQTLNGENKIISNDVTFFSRPIFDDKYSVGTALKSQKVAARYKVTFNNTSFVLLEDENGVLLGYVPEGYLTSDVLTLPSTTITSNETIFENGSRRTSNVLMVMIIAFTLTAAALIIEYKTLFKKAD